MAVVFTTDISETQLLRTHENHVVEFSSDSGLVPYKAQIDIAGAQFEISPISGAFKFNFRNIFESLVSDSFQDSVDAVLNGGDLDSFVVDGSDVYTSQSAVITIYFTNGSTETIARTVKLLLSTADFLQRQLNEISTSDEFGVLHYPKDQTNRIYSLVHGAGLPWDFSVYRNTPGPVTLTNETNGLDASLNLQYKVNRIFFSGSNTDITIDDVLPLAFGKNTIVANDSQVTTVEIEKRKANDCGVYLKWRNRQGGWSYWFFEKPKVVTGSYTDFGYIQNDLAGLENQDAIKNIGKQRTDSWTIGTVNASIEQRNFILGCLESPKVYLFTGLRFSSPESYEWLAVRVLTESAEVARFKDRIGDIDISIELPARNAYTI